MPQKPASSPARHRRMALVWRGLGVLILVLLLHALVVGWVTDNLGSPFFQQHPADAIVVKLVPPPAPAPAVISPPLPPALPARPASHPRPPKAKPHRKATLAAPAPEAPPPVTANALDMPVPPDAIAEQEVTTSDATAAATGAAADSLPGAPAAGPPVAGSAPDTHAATRGQTDAAPALAPPSADLKFDVTALRDGSKVYGTGRIQWKNDGAHYSEHGEASVLFFTVLRFDSIGTIDARGVNPELYNEKRFRKSETNTHFHRGRNLISFSASTVTYPRQGGEQDRGSVVWQIAAMANGDPHFMAAGKEIALFVAGVRDGEVWRLRVVGEETLALGGQQMRAWHVERLPKPGSYDQKIDLWFAPDRSWYPVRLLFTETNGEYLDMVLADVQAPPPH